MGLNKNNNLLNCFQGKQCLIHSLTISVDQESYLLIMRIHVETTESEAILTMYNVSNVKMDFCSSAFCIEGFEIIDNSNRGWSSEVQYCLNDYENGVLKLYFEKYDIVACEKEM